jgi:hypothetical protein
MRDRNSSWRRMVRFLGLLLAFTAAACNGGPAGPSDAELFALYTGTWRGNINGLQVVLDVQATKGWGLPDLEGSGTALNPATGEMHMLTISGLVSSHRPESQATTVFNLETARVFGPGGVLLGGGQHTGMFNGNVSRDGRTWPGRFSSTTSNFGAPIFGPGEHSVTLTKD